MFRSNDATPNGQQWNFGRNSVLHACVSTARSNTSVTRFCENEKLRVIAWWRIITVGFAGSRESGRALRESPRPETARDFSGECVVPRPSCSTLPKVPLWSSASRAHTLSSGAPPELSLSPRRDASRRRDAPTRPPRRLTPSTRASSTTAATTVVRYLSRRVSRTKRTTAGLPDCSSVGNAHRDPPWLLNRSCEHVARSETSASWVRSDSEESPYFLWTPDPNSRQVT